MTAGPRAARARTGRDAVTIRDVAQRAGVSKSLVSLVMRGYPHVSAVRREAVLKAARELGYRPNAMARGLVEQRTETVGVVISDMRNPYYVDLVESFQGVLQDAGFRTLLGNGRLDALTGDSLVEAFLQLRVDGLCLVGTFPQSQVIADAADLVPAVAASGRDMRLPRTDMVANDDFHGALLATRHLLGLGHRRVTHIGGCDGAVAAARQAGYEEAMRGGGAGADIRVQRSDFTERAGYDAAMTALSARPRPTAVFAVNDVACVGALSAADELGIAVPGQLSLVGYDNTYLAGIRHLSLSTVDPVNTHVGRIAGHALLDRLEDPDRPGLEQLIEPHLVVRGSSAPPPAG